MYSRLVHEDGRGGVAGASVVVGAGHRVVGGGGRAYGEACAVAAVVPAVGLRAGGGEGGALAGGDGDIITDSDNWMSHHYNGMYSCCSAERIVAVAQRVVNLHRIGVGRSRNICIDLSGCTVHRNTVLVPLVLQLIGNRILL